MSYVPILKNLTIVDAVYGNDQFGERNNFLAPFKTIKAAFASSQPADAIEICPGTYTDINLTANAVTVYFKAGASLISTATTGTDTCFNFTNTNNFTIAGEGHFRIINPLMTSGEVQSPCVFRIANTTVNIEAGLIEGYQTDANKTGQHFLSCFSGNSGTLNLNCSSIGGNMPLSNPFNIVNTGAFCIYSLAFCFNNSGNVAANAFANLNITCNGNINTLYDGNYHGKYSQWMNIVAVQSSNAINCSTLILAPANANSFYKSTNLNFDTIIAGYHNSGVEAYFNYSYLNFYIENVLINANGAGAGIYIYSTGSVQPAMSFNSFDINANFDFSNDLFGNSSLVIKSAYVSSFGPVQNLYGPTLLDVGLWFTDGQGFYSPFTGNVTIGGSMIVDSGFAQGNAPILAGTLVVNNNILPPQ